MRVIGLMSGTSLDGIDAARIDTDGETIQAFGPSLTLPYDEDFRDRLRAILGGVGPVAEVERDLTLRHAQAVRALLAESGGTVDLVGFHGQTILHRPQERRTWQIGDGALLARELGIDVVADFRQADVAAGGQGAPLVPLYHAALACNLDKPLAVLNIGGVANLTYLGSDGSILAFDTGPGNALLDDWMLAQTGQPFDQDGRLASSGIVDAQALDRFAAHPYFAQPGPKSLDRDEFAQLAGSLVAGKNPADGAATLAALTIKAVALALRHLPERPRRWVVCGGGRRNPFLMAGLETKLGIPVEPVERQGWDGDALEAQAFGFLAVRALKGLPLTLPTTTGAPGPMTGGRVVRAGRKTGS
ncbi:MAG: anhydro-N-acetylmuramic acid kinase [Rhodospirillales bacterium]|nr:anhydro-N-acetylmuramic acid kinase [Rhodospirillales bacterium]